jgi:hypothetical protein
MDIVDTLDWCRRGSVRAAVHATADGHGLITIAKRGLPFESPSAALASWFDFLMQVRESGNFFREEETHGNTTH